jgi:hypothetical protein
LTQLGFGFDKGIGHDYVDNLQKFIYNHFGLC